ncbi:hypothetical protein KAU11_09750 [Candidatus Babeliales bacterium]|nr:hypothetical protein [Candidatus Babeliales bacterium]
MNPKRLFKVGDKVKIIANTNESRNKVGDIGIISNIGPCDVNVEVKGRPKYKEDGEPSCGNYTLFDEVELYRSYIDRFWDWIIKNRLLRLN